jgi:UDP-N-acetylmuramoylalanine--D-glutamate ligase
MQAVMTAPVEYGNSGGLGQGARAAEYTLVVGLGASGLAAARHLAALGEPVLVIDSRDAPPGRDALRRECPGARLELGTLDARWLERARRVVLSPGLSVDLPLIAAARQNQLEVVGELELFARAANAPVIGVTGSNGKSTVTTLTAHLLAAQGFSAPAGGNLGPPALELLGREHVDVYVLEVSSFQMETTTSLAPIAAALLNISPDHMDRHGSLERYAALKVALLEAARRIVINHDDPLVRRLAPRNRETVAFSTRETLAEGWSLVPHRGEHWIARAGRPLLPRSGLPLRGEIGEANALAALALAESMGGDTERALTALARFAGLPHRLEHVRERQGVAWVNDSKGTNIGATIAAIQGASAPIVLIAGGQGKGADFAPLAEAAAGRVKAAVLLGEAAQELEAVFAGRIPTVRVADMPAAVAEAARLAVAGDWVLLSPACASQDMFKDYRERGAVFAEAARRLPA